MAKWLIYRRGDNTLGLLYVSALTGLSEKLGVIRSDTPKDMVVEWVANRAAVAPGDVLVFPDGRGVLFSREVGVA